MTSRLQSQPDPQLLDQPRAPVRPPLILWVLVVLSLLCIGGGVWQLQQNRQVSTSQAASAPVESLSQATDFRLTALDGSQVQLSSLHGKVVLLNFWATWCPPCKAEMPDLDALHRQYGPQHDFTVVGVNLAESQAAVAAFSRQYNLSFPLLLDSNGTVSDQSYNIRSLPTSIIIDRQGKARDMWIGQISREAMKVRLERVW
jgi:thiol-disulfide isomerase/thioredoxin